jgi:hypothetical protein
MVERSESDSALKLKSHRVFGDVGTTDHRIHRKTSSRRRIVRRSQSIEELHCCWNKLLA